MDIFIRNLDSMEIPYTTPTSPDFMSIQESYTGTHESAQPSIAVLPRNSTEVSIVVQQCLACCLPFITRGRGHDVFGRFTRLNTVSIDLRNLNLVQVSPALQDGGSWTARVGGGATMEQVLQELAKYQLQTPIGACGDVGFVSWALIGGFGPYMNCYGLGADQIVGARVVNANGELVDADARLLKGLRGGGGCLAIVAELVVKVYSIQPVQAGAILYDSTDMNKSASTFFTNLNTLMVEHKDRIPRRLQMIPMVMPSPAEGMALGCAFVWNGPASEEMEQWVNRVANLAPRMPGGPDPHTTVNNTTALAFSQLVTKLLAPTIRGRCQAVSLTHYSSSVVTSLSKLLANIPAGSTGGINVHMLRSESPACSTDVPDSVCPYREPQILIELLGYGKDEHSISENSAWAVEARDKLSSSDAARKSIYLPFVAPDVLSLEDAYGDKLIELRRIKNEYDPQNIFRNTIPCLD